MPISFQFSLLRKHGENSLPILWKNPEKREEKKTIW